MSYKRCLLSKWFSWLLIILFSFYFHFLVPFYRQLYKTYSVLTQISCLAMIRKHLFTQKKTIVKKYCMEVSILILPDR